MHISSEWNQFKKKTKTCKRRDSYQALNSRTKTTTLMKTRPSQATAKWLSTKILISASFKQSTSIKKCTTYLKTRVWSPEKTCTFVLKRWAVGRSLRVRKEILRCFSWKLDGRTRPKPLGWRKRRRVSSDFKVHSTEIKGKRELTAIAILNQWWNRLDE